MQTGKVVHISKNRLCLFLIAKTIFRRVKALQCPHSFISLSTERKDTSLISELESNLWEEYS